MKQTAVDWLVDQIENFNCMKLGLIPSDIIEEAKKREESYIINKSFIGFCYGILSAIVGILLGIYL